MALTKLERKASGVASPGRKPFLSDYYEENPGIGGNNYEVELVKETNSRSGYLLETKQFVCCVFKSQDITDELLELVEECYSRLHCALYLIIDEEESCGFQLAYDPEAKRTWVRTKKYPGGNRYAHAQAGRKSKKPPRNLSEPQTTP